MPRPVHSPNTVPPCRINGDSIEIKSSEWTKFEGVFLVWMEVCLRLNKTNPNPSSNKRLPMDKRAILEVDNAWSRYNKNKTAIAKTPVENNKTTGVVNITSSRSAHAGTDHLVFCKWLEMSIINATRMHEHVWLLFGSYDPILFAACVRLNVTNSTLSHLPFRGASDRSNRSSLFEWRGNTLPSTKQQDQERKKKRNLLEDSRVAYPNHDTKILLIGGSRDRFVECDDLIHSYKTPYAGLFEQGLCEINCATPIMMECMYTCCVGYHPRTEQQEYPRKRDIIHNTNIENKSNKKTDVSNVNVKNNVEVNATCNNAITNVLNVTHITDTTVVKEKGAVKRALKNLALRIGLKMAGRKREPDCQPLGEDA